MHKLDLEKAEDLPNPEIETASLASNFREKKISGLWK